ncbi:hypothetical protein Y032_0569g65 [Ancylostoma ceylanicum]|uniref:CCHC-type domain-containing protein n=1 Tax=Ancylostoma ceylanicum TaxID=53326 RepID=A0A016WP74_9BILA|nr:hypothetical protein Y032_0569g65 [Ancylostoma ceylanicum]
MGVQDVDMREISDEEDAQVRSVSTSRISFPDSLMSKELEVIGEILQSIPESISVEVGDHKVSARYKEKLNESLSKRIGELVQRVSSLKENCKVVRILHGSVANALQQRGIDSEQEWEQYLATIERDGELLAEICEILNTDVLQIVKVVRQVKHKADAYDEEEENGGVKLNGELLQRVSGERQGNAKLHEVQLQETPKREQIGASCAHDWKRCVATSSEGTREAAGQQINLEVLNCLQSLSCVDPGIYKGKSNENFKEFVRRFRRKYQRAVLGDQTLVEILGDDHLGGRAKSVFLSLPVEVKNRGFDEVIKEMGKLLSEDSVAGRIRAIAELRDMKMRPNQDVADFCVALEKLGRKANPEGSIEDRSLEFAQILLANLKHWPEHVQLLGALHRVTPEKAYEEVKQLALSMELSKKLYEPIEEHAQNRRWDWKGRSMLYSNSGIQKKHERENEVRSYRARTPEREERFEGKDRSRFDGYERYLYEDRVERRERKYSNGTNTEARKCFSCSEWGHISRECPLKREQVREVVQNPTTTVEHANGRRISQILNSARSLGVKATCRGLGAQPLIGHKVSAWTNLLGSRTSAILDTGSMISIIPVGILAQAKRKGFDVDSLKVIDDEEMEFVYDASGNRMDFLGAVKIPVALEGGKSSVVAFHIVDRRDEVVLGTNSLTDLGVELRVGRQCEVNKLSQDGQRFETVTVAKRVDTLPHGATVVPARCATTGDREGILLSSRKEIQHGWCKIHNQQSVVQVANTRVSKAVGAVESIGQRGSKRRKGSWEDMDPVEQDNPIEGLSCADKQELFKQRKVSSPREEETRARERCMLKNFTDASAVQDRGLTQIKLSRAKRRRKSAKVRENKQIVPYFSEPTLTSPLGKKHRCFMCSDGLWRIHYQQQFEREQFSGDLVRNIGGDVLVGGGHVRSVPSWPRRSETAYQETAHVSAGKPGYKRSGRWRPAGFR